MKLPKQFIDFEGDLFIRDDNEEYYYQNGNNTLDKYGKEYIRETIDGINGPYIAHWEKKNRENLLLALKKEQFDEEMYEIANS